MSASSFIFPIAGAQPKNLWQRIDKGQDFQTRPGSALVAVTSGTLAAGNDPGGFGPRYPVLHGDDGRSYYYGHVDLPAGLEGKHVTQGAVIARTGAPRGNATSPGWLEFGDASLLGHGGETGGGAISAMLHRAAGKGGGGRVGVGAAAAGGAASGAALGTAIEPGIGTAVGAAGGAVVGGVGSLLQGPISDAEGAAGKAAAGAVTDLANSAWGYVKDHWGAFLLKVAFVIAGAALLVTGVATALGVQQQLRATVRAVPKAVPVPV